MKDILYMITYVYFFNIYSLINYANTLRKISYYMTLFAKCSYFCTTNQVYFDLNHLLPT